MEETKKCPKCTSEMEKGIMLSKVPPKWMTKVKLLTLKDESRRVITFRCKACGYLESYAE